MGGYQPKEDLTTNPPGFEDIKWTFPFEMYLVMVGERLPDYRYTPEDVIDNIDYFKECHKNNLSAYKALEWLNYELDEDTLKEIRERPAKYKEDGY